MVTGSGVATILVYRRLTKTPEMGNTPVWVLPSIWRLEQFMDTKFGKDVSDKNLLNDVKKPWLQLLPSLSY